MTQITKIGYTHGRFQPVHNGHFKVMLYILKNYDQLWVGIANPLRELPKNIESLVSDLRNSIKKAREPKNNPYSYIERYNMIYSSLKLYGVDMKRVKILPHFGAYETENWADFFPPKEQTTIILPAKEIYHYKKLEIYRKESWKVEIIPQFPGISGKIFDKEFPNGNWKKLVPKGAIEIIERKIKKRRMTEHLNIALNFC